MEPEKRRRLGPLSNEELSYIENNYQSMTTEEIANNLGRSMDVVRKRIGEIRATIKAEEDVILEKEILFKLESRADWISIKKQFSEEELKIFREMWVKMTMQFNNDVLPTESNQIINVIRIELLVNRNLEERNKITNQYINLEKEKEEIERKILNTTDPMELRELANKVQEKAIQLESSSAALSSRSTEYEKLTEKSRQSYKDLKSTRDQRFTKIAESKEKFTDWLAHLYEKDKFEAEGKELALRKLAMEKEKKRLSEYHKFMDDKLDQPFLTPETVMERKDG